MKTIKTIILSFACLAMASCDFLDKEPTKLTPDNYFNNAEEALSFLTSVYAPLTSQNFYGNEYMFMTGADDLSHYGGGRNPQTSGAIACNNANSSSPQFSNLWQTLYTGIDRANTFLENIDKTDDISDKLRLQYASEARFMRAYYYFTLVQGWGDVPFKTTSTNSVTGLDIPRTDKQTIYDFITTEISECAEGLPQLQNWVISQDTFHVPQHGVSWHAFIYSVPASTSATTPVETLQPFKIISNKPAHTHKR